MRIFELLPIIRTLSNESISFETYENRSTTSKHTEDTAADNHHTNQGVSGLLKATNWIPSGRQTK